MKKLYILILFFFITGCGSSSDPSDNVLADKETEEVELNCQVRNGGINWDALSNSECVKLSSYNLFSDNTDPRAGANASGIRYELNSELFTDYARKYRYVFLPPNEKSEYSEQESFKFPVGSVLVKVFALPLDTALPEENIIEIRLLIHRAGGWVGLVYVWQKESQDAVLDLDSESINFSLLHNGDIFSGEYRVPSFGSCATCHQFNDKMSPIGPKARLLNKDIDFQIDGDDQSITINQLQLWGQQDMLSGLPDNLSEIDAAPDWRDETKNLSDRAKAYLDINCAHCHRAEGAASLSGLKLEYGRKTIDYNHGVCNSAHGWRGGGFDIWPGNSGQSSLVERMTLSPAPDRMPPLGRSLVDVDAVELIKQWIDAMPYQECAQQNN
jgi:uncharacterized repeat protein (TIGR03806 family)